MSSLPTFEGSVSSVHNVLVSYRRAQYFIAGSNVASLSDDSERQIEELEDGDAHEGDVHGISEVLDSESIASHPITRRDSHEFISQFDWDDDLDTPQPHTLSTSYLGSSKQPTSEVIAHEDTPLLSRKVSFGTTPRPLRISPAPDAFTRRPSHSLTYTTSHDAGKHTLRPPIPKRMSTQSFHSTASSAKFARLGQSTFGQTLFNSVAILLGIGMLSEPLAFACAGWGAGTVLIIFYGYISCYTAKLLGNIILSDPSLRSYSDIGRKAFGPRSTIFISLLFCMELFAVSVVLVTLYADSLNSVMPTYSSNTYKLIGIILLVPMVFLPLSLLSYLSILGILSTIMIIAVILIDGFSKPDFPGSLRDPAPTSFGIESWSGLGIAFGLYMAGFSGHAVIPSLARDMVDPTQFDRMINWAFTLATFFYAMIGYAGYLMFGNTVSDEISIDLLKTPGYNEIVNQACLWMLVISPLSKFALTTQPLNATIEIVLQIDAPLNSPEAVADRLAAPFAGQIPIRKMLSIAQRVVVTILAVAVSILVPEFSSMMAFLGAFAAFMICIIGPLGANIALTGKVGKFDGTVFVIAFIMAAWGTAAAFLDM